jgi:hypothetical protein
MPLLAAQIGYAVLSAQVFQHDPDLVFSIKCRRVARGISFTTRSAEALEWPECFGLIFVPSSLR